MARKLSTVSNIDHDFLEESWLRLRECNDLDDLERVASELLFERFGNSDFFYLGVRRDVPGDPPMRLLGKETKRIVKDKLIYYQKQGIITHDDYMKRDPIARIIFKEERPLIWPDNLPTPNSDFDAFILRKQTDGGRLTGFTVPLRKTGWKGSFTIATDAGERHLRKVIDDGVNVEFFMSQVRFMINRIMEKRNNSNLTTREIQAIYWASHGKSAWETAQILGLSERTINAHLTTAQQKMGAKNKTNTVAKSIWLGVIDFNSFRSLQ